jgi:hypothetical protein
MGRNDLKYTFTDVRFNVMVNNVHILNPIEELHRQVRF